jgi:hypothetical protein
MNISITQVVSNLDSVDSSTALCLPRLGGAKAFLLLMVLAGANADAELKAPLTRIQDDNFMVRVVLKMYVIDMIRSCLLD